MPTILYKGVLKSISQLYHLKLCQERQKGESYNRDCPNSSKNYPHPFIFFRNIIHKCILTIAVKKGQKYNFGVAFHEGLLGRGLRVLDGVLEKCGILSNPKTLPQERGSRRFMFNPVTGFVVGGAIGAGLGLLFTEASIYFVNAIVQRGALDPQAIELFKSNREAAMKSWGIFGAAIGAAAAMRKDILNIL